MLEDVADVPPALERQNKIRLYHVGIIARIIGRKSAIHDAFREVTDNNMTAYAYICIFFCDNIFYLFRSSAVLVLVAGDEETHPEV